MKERTSRSLLRSVALVGAMAAGATAFGDFYDWKTDEKGYWEDETSWETGAADFTDYRIGNHGSEIGFRSLVEADDANAVLVYNGEHTFVADEASFGLKKANAPLNVNAPWWFTGTPILNIASGAYEFASVNLNPDGTYGGSTTLNLNGGTLATTYVSIGAGCTVSLNGGTLVLGDDSSVAGNGTLVVGANGGTIESLGISGTISTALTGSGTLTKTGAGQLIIDGVTTGFEGTITVAEGAGSVTIGEVEIVAGETQSFAKDTTYYWTGAAGDDLWATPGNWSVNGEVPTAPPAADSVVVIPEGEGELTILCAYATDYTGYLTINRDVKLARARPSDTSGPNGVNITKVEGTGTLTLAGGYRSSGDATQDRFHVRRGADNLPFEIDVDLNTTGRLRFMDPNGVPRLTLNGALKGDGIIYYDNHSNGEGIIFNGDTSAFTGSFTGCSAGSWGREGTKFGGDARGSVSASWTFGCWEGGDRGVYGYTPFLVNDVTYQFGQLNAPRLHFWRGYTGSNTTGATVEVGALAGKTSTVTGSLAPDNTLRKVGATSTLEYTNSGTANGTVEAYEGTTVIKGTATGFALKFTGPTATIKIARSSTTTTEVASGVEDDPETPDVDESKTTETTTTTYIPAAFVPGFADELAGGQYEVAQEVVEGVTYDVYTVVKVAKDSADNEYYSVAAAITALAEAENKTITLTHDYSTTVELPLGYTLDSAGYSCTVTGVAGVGVVEENGVWTTVDNAAATWQGDAAGANWADAANWSTGVVPNEGTAVTFNYNAIVYISDHDNLAHKCSTIKLKDGISVEFAPTDHNQDLYPRLAIYGENVWGNATLKLYRCGLYNAHGSKIKIFPRVLFENKGVGFDSWVQNGSFEFAREVTGTGMFVCYNACQFNAGITVEGDNIVDCRATPTFAQNATLNGDGTLICYNGMPGDRLASALANSEKWTGTFHLKNTTHTTVTWLSRLGNSNSKVVFDNVTTYLYTSLGDGNHAVGEMEIAAGGFKVNGNYSSGDFVFPAKLTGTGTFTVGIAGNNNKNVQFTGDCSAFAGTIAWADDTVNTRVVVGDDTSAEFAAKTIVVNEGSTLGLGGFSGTIVGGGTVYGPAYPQTVGTFDADNWTGEFVIGWTINGGELNLNRYGTANSTVVLGTDMTAGWMTVTSFNPTLRLDANMTINNGSSNKTTTFAEVTGTGNLAFTAWLGGVPTFAITKFSDYTGTLSTSGNSAVTIGTVNVSEFVPGEPVVKLAANANLTTDPANITFTIDGNETDFDLIKADDGLYVAVAAVTVTPAEGDPVTTQFATYEAAVAFADENNVTSFAVLAGDGVVNGWDYDSEAGTLTKNTTAIARVGTTQFDTLADAFEAATANDAVILFGASAEDIELDENGAMFELDATSTYTGTLSGDGTVVADKDVTPTFSEWTGTFVMNWDTSAATSSTGWQLDKYGVSGSTVVVAQPLQAGYLNRVEQAGAPTIAPAVYLEANVSINNGFAGDNQMTTFAELGADEGVTFSFRYLAGAQEKDKTYYTITKLNNFDGTLVLNPYNQVVVNAVELDATPAFGTKVVNATVDATASLTGKIADGKPLVAKADGLYFDPVAQVDEAYYNTAVEAITAAAGAVVDLVKTTDETYTMSAGETVKIHWNNLGNVVMTTDIAGARITDTWDEDAGVTTYTCTAPKASANVGGEVTYYVDWISAAGYVSQNGTTGDSFTILDGTVVGEISGFTWDSETNTYTLAATVVAQFTLVETVHKYATLAEACADAATLDPVPTVTLLVARDSIEEEIPDGWEYNTPEASGTEFGTLTKVVGVITVDTDGSNFTVDAATAEAITVATGVATDSENFGKAAIAYVVGGELVADEVVIPTPTITVANGTVTVKYASEDAQTNKYTVTCTLWTFDLADANDPSKWTKVATGSIGDNLVDSAETLPPSKFYTVTVTVEDAKVIVVEESGSGEGA